MLALLVVTGPPGAGKSTVARALAQRWEPSVLVAGDAFFGFLARGAIAPWLPEAHEQNTAVTRAAAVATGRFAERFHTIYDGIVGPWFLDEFLAGTGLRSLAYVVLLPSVETCVDRVATRVDHEFSDETATRQMHRQFADSQLPGRHVLTAPGVDAERIADRIAVLLTAGELTYSVDPSTGLDHRSALRSRR